MEEKHNCGKDQDNTNMQKVDTCMAQCDDIGKQNEEDQSIIPSNDEEKEESFMKLMKSVRILQNDQRDNCFHEDKELQGPFIKQTDVLQEQFNVRNNISSRENKESKKSSCEKKEFSTELNFQNIQDECLRDKIRFEDPDFRPCNASLFVQKDHWAVNLNIQWKRASQICDNPHFFIDDVTKFDIKQGELGDCWLLAAMADLTLHKKLFHKVVPLDQSFIEGYAGMFHFK